MAIKQSSNQAIKQSSNIIKLASIFLASTWLAACGSSSSSTSTSHTLDLSNVDIVTKFNADDHGVTDTVDQLEAFTGINDDRNKILLNEKHTRTIKANEYSDYLEFTAEEGGPVLFVLNSEAEDFDFVIPDSSGNYLESESDGSFEYILLEAQAGNSYYISVYNESDDNETADATYTISATKPNRELVKMVDGDYFISVTLESEETCQWYDIWDGEIEKGESTEPYTYTESFFAIINWGKGYIKQGDEQYNFNAADQDKLEVKFTVSDKDSGEEVADWKPGKPTVIYSGSEQLNYTLRLNTSDAFSVLTGSMEGSYNWNEDYSDGDKERETCTVTAEITGEVLF